MHRNLWILGGLLIARSVASAPPPGDKAPSDKQIWADLEAGNKRFITGVHAHDRAALVSSQAPQVAVLACSDSRVGPELLFDKSLGDLFVVRNAGNTPDPIGVGSLEYAVEHLHTTVIVVMGHTSCGAVAAACSGEKAETPSLAAVVEPIAPSCTAAKKGDKTDLVAAVKDHVHRSAQQLLTQSPIIKDAVAHGKVAIIEAYYELDSGRVVRLDQAVAGNNEPGATRRR